MASRRQGLWRGLVRLVLVSLVLWTVFASAASAATGTINGTVTNGSGQTGRIYLRAFWSDIMGTWDTDSGTSITAAGGYAIRGVEAPGTFAVFGFVDENGDGVANIDEASGWSAQISIDSNGVVTGSGNLTLSDPLPGASPAALQYLEVKSLNTALLVFWDAPQDQFVWADHVKVEWSASASFSPLLGSKTVPAVSGWDDLGDALLIPTLTNNTTYHIRVTTILNGVEATPTVITGVPTAGAGVAVAGTVDTTPVAGAVGKPCLVVLAGPGEDNFYVQYLQTLTAGANAFSIANVPTGKYILQAFVDANNNGQFGTGDYRMAAPLTVTVSAAVSGQALTVSTMSGIAGIETHHVYDDAPVTPLEYYELHFNAGAVAKQPASVNVTGPYLPVGGLDLAWVGDEAMGMVEIPVGTPPAPTDIYTFAITYADDTTESLTVSPIAPYSAPKANTITVNAGEISWTPSATVPAGWVSEASIHNDSVFWDSDEFAAATNKLTYDGPSLGAGTYIAEVSLCDLDWNCVRRTEAKTIAAPSGTCVAPASITVPASDGDGSIYVSWTSVAGTGNGYVLEEATVSDFSDAQEVYRGTVNNATLRGRVFGKVYYYQVKTINIAKADSVWKLGANGCKVPGTAAAPPTNLTIPSVDADGRYLVSWTASPTPGTTTYVLEESTSPTLSPITNTYAPGSATQYEVNNPYAGTPVTYYYRVKTQSVGYADSSALSQTPSVGCKVIGLGTQAAAPATLTVPATDADGSYSVSWTGSTTAGMQYLLEESTDPQFGSISASWTVPATNLALTGRAQSATYYYRVTAVDPNNQYANSEPRYTANLAGCAVPGTILTAPATLTVPAADLDGAGIVISWSDVAGDGESYVLQYATNSGFTAELSPELPQVGTTATITLAAPVEGTTYYFRVKTRKPGYSDSTWRTAAAGCKILPANATMEPPGTLTVPTNDLDGAYNVSWLASATAGAQYILEETTTPADEQSWVAYPQQPGLTKAITGRALYATYYYRVKAVDPNGSYLPSAYRTTATGAGCAVPGTALAAPATLTVPAADADGVVAITWGTVTGATYVLQYATNNTYTAGLSAEMPQVGTTATVTIDTPVLGTTYYFRVKARKAGNADSPWKTLATGCKIIDANTPAAIPGTLTVPATDADGSYTVSWLASTTAGVTYELEEWTDPAFADSNKLVTTYTTTGLNQAISGKALGSYYYRVRAGGEYTPSGWRTTATGAGCKVPGTALTAPTTLSVPAVSANGTYIISWTPVVAGVTYVVQEATNSTFTNPTTLDPALISNVDGTASISNGTTTATYYYRVMATAPDLGLTPSGWKTNTVGCKVIGTNAQALPPATLTVPAGSATGAYTVNWTASPTAANMQYVLEESTDGSNWTAYPIQSTLSRAITGRATGATYYYRVLARDPDAQYQDSAPKYTTSGAGCAVPGTVLAAPATLTVPLVSADGAYDITWGASPTVASGITYELQESTSSTFATILNTYPNLSVLSQSISGNTTLGATYYYRVKAKRAGYVDSPWKTLTAGCKIIAPGTPASLPGTLTVPQTDADGSYVVSWLASATLGVTYLLEEASDAAFQNITNTYSGINGLKQSITAPLGIYYYRVKVEAGDYAASDWKTGANACKVPGTALAAPATLTVPSVDADGNFQISWTPVVAGVTYVVQEATNSTFTNPTTVDPAAISNVDGTATLSKGATAATYYYRVMATAPALGLTPSGWKTGTAGCKVIGTGTKALPPASLTVPASSATGTFSVSWTASPTAANMQYILEESTDGSNWTAYAPQTVLNKAFTTQPANVTYYYRVFARDPNSEYADSDPRYTTSLAGCAVPGTAAVAPASLSVPLVDAADGVDYAVSWGASTTSGVTYVLQEATNSTFTTDVVTYPTTSSLSQVITDKTVAAVGKTYFYRVKARKAGYADSTWKTLTTGCKIIAANTQALPPGTLTVPAGSTTGSYTVSWTASATPGMEYILEESTDKTNWSTVVTQTALSKAFTSKAMGTVYYYRVTARDPKGQYADSAPRYTATTAGCAVPGTLLTAPSTLTVPTTSANGNLNITWSATTTPSGVTYELQRATNSTFTTGVQPVETFATNSASITGLTNGTYFFRVRVTKTGYTSSTWKATTVGSVVNIVP